MRVSQASDEASDEASDQASGEASDEAPGQASGEASDEESDKALGQSRKGFGDAARPGSGRLDTIEARYANQVTLCARQRLIPITEPS